MRKSLERKRKDVPRVRLSADPERLAGARPLWDNSDNSDNSVDGVDDVASSGDEPRAELHNAVRTAVEASLTAKQREVVEAYFFEGLSQGDIARRPGISQQVVQKRLYGAPRGGKLVGGAIHRLRGVLAERVSS
jgi:RNA polymerase sigma factor (sigma-70 family)